MSVDERDSVAPEYFPGVRSRVAGHDEEACTRAGMRIVHSLPRGCCTQSVSILYLNWYALSAQLDGGRALRALAGLLRCPFNRKPWGCAQYSCNSGREWALYIYYMCHIYHRCKYTPKSEYVKCPPGAAIKQHGETLQTARIGPDRFSAGPAPSSFRRGAGGRTRRIQQQLPDSLDGLTLTLESELGLAPALRARDRDWSTLTTAGRPRCSPVLLPTSSGPLGIQSLRRTGRGLMLIPSPLFGGGQG